MFSGRCGGSTRYLFPLSLASLPSRSNKFSAAKRLANSGVPGDKRFYFEEKYNPEETEKILKTLNEAKCEDDLKRFVISSRRTAELMKMRTDVGAFKDLDDLIPIMDVKILDKFYNSMLDKKSLGLGNPMVPSLPADKVSSFTRILSISIIGNKLSWSLVRRGENSRLNVDSLQLRQFNMTPKVHFLSLLKQVRVRFISDLAQELPPCDLCITEDFATLVPSTYMFSYYLQLTQVRSMLLGYLAAQPNGPQLVSIKTVAVGRLFNTYIGSEKVSGQLVVENLFKNSKNLDLNLNSNVKYLYLEADPETKECLSNVFLLNLTYWKLTSQCNLT